MPMMAYADDGANFHLIEHTAGPEIAAESGFFRADENRAMVQRSVTAGDGRQHHVRLLLWREGGDLRLVLFTSDGTGPLSVQSSRLLHAVLQR